MLCSKEDEIDRMLEQVQEQGVDTAKVYLSRAAGWLGGLIIKTAVRGGTQLGATLRNSYSLTDLSQSLEWSRGRFTDISEEQQAVHNWVQQSGNTLLQCLGSDSLVL